MVRHRFTTLAAITAAAALALAACGSSGDTAADSPAPSGPPSAGDQSTESTLPADGTADDTADTSTPGDAETEGNATTTGEGGEASGTASGAGALPADCSPEQLQTTQAGTLTIATDEPVYEPWFVDNDPSNGQGYEGAVAYAVAGALGYADDDVAWVRASFDSVISPAPKNFDFDINEFSITPDRAKVVDFSSGYYDVAQAVVSVKGSAIADATSVADLADAHLGAQVGTTSLQVINDVVEPSQKPAVFNQNIDAVTALKNGQIDGIVTDLPTAFYMSAAQLDNGVLVGQLANTGDDTEQFGLLLEKDSPITSCVSAAVDSLRADGTLEAIQDQWLAQAGAPVLK